MELSKKKVTILFCLVLWALASVGLWLFRFKDVNILYSRGHFGNFSTAIVSGLFSYPNQAEALGACPTVHVVLMVENEAGNWPTYLTVKSILFHRSTPVHFHFITEQQSRRALGTMLDTWLVPDISYSFYNLGKALSGVSKWTHSHPKCSKALSVYLNLHKILPASVQHVIAVEPASVVTVDLYELFFSTVNSKKVVTVCMSGCTQYCPHFCPYNCPKQSPNAGKWGVLGINLHSTSYRHSNMYELCYPNGRAYETIMNSISSFASQFQECTTSSKQRRRSTISHCKEIQDYDGNRLRYWNATHCLSGGLVGQPPPEDMECPHYEWERATLRRELPFLLGHHYTSSDPYDVTLINHLDFNRLNILERSLTNWDGPVNIAIQLTDSEVEKFISYIRKSSVLHDRLNISYHVMFKVGPVYPINPLREQGHRFASTPFVFFGDIDYVSSYSMYTTMKQNLKEIDKSVGDLHKVAMVIPAFETLPWEKHFVVPRTKQEMVQFYVTGRVFQFHVQSYPIGHASTDYYRWTMEDKPYSVTWTESYEPYLLLERSVFSFDTQFLSRVHNKGSHVFELFLSGFRFVVLPECFIVHFPHTRVINANLANCSKEWYYEWIREKVEKYHFNGAYLDYGKLYN